MHAVGDKDALWVNEQGSGLNSELRPPAIVWILFQFTYETKRRLDYLLSRTEMTMVA